MQQQSHISSDMARKKRTTRKAVARAAAVPAADVAPPSTDPMRTLIAATSQRVCVSLSSTTASSSAQPDPEPASPAHDDNTDSDAPQQRRKRTKVGHYNPRLTEEQRLDILRLHISEGKTARAIHKLYEARGHIVPEGTIYTLFRKQAHNRPLVPQKKRTAHKRYTEEDRRVVVQAQTDHNDWTYDQLRSAWAAANPESRYRPQQRHHTRLAERCGLHQQAARPCTQGPQRAGQHRRSAQVQPGGYDVGPGHAHLHRRDDVQQRTAQQSRSQSEGQARSLHLHSTRPGRASRCAPPFRRRRAWSCGTHSYRRTTARPSPSSLHAFVLSPPCSTSRASSSWTTCECTVTG